MMVGDDARLTSVANPCQGFGCLVFYEVKMTTKKTVYLNVHLDECRAHLFKVTLSLDQANPNQALFLPIWTPGSYMVREFAQHIVSIKASNNCGDIAISKTNKNTFVLDNQSQDVVVSYEVYGFDSSIRSAFIDESQAFFNGTALFLCPKDFADANFIVVVHRPKDRITAFKEVATGMPSLDVDNQGFGSYIASSYQELVDYPFQISEMKRINFWAANLPHQMALIGDVRPFDEQRLVEDLTRLCESQIKLFNEIPFTTYLFIARFEEGGHGGLEHRNSSMLLASPYCLPKSESAEQCSHYRNFLSLCSHEYFHAWYIKRLKPPNFITYNFHEENYTTLLWFFEGFTAYYDDLMVKRAGLMSLSSYLELLGKNYSKLLRTQGRHVQSLAESSFDAWIKFYRPNENSMNAGVSYYLKGSFLALYLDLLIRKQSDHRYSLDQVMASLQKIYGSAASITDEELLAQVCEVADIDVDAFKKNYILGVKDVPIASLLSEFGLDLTISSDELFLDDKTKMSSFLGIKLRFDENDRALINFVEQDSPGMQAGLCFSDELIAVNNVRLEPSNLSDLFSSIKINQEMNIIYSRKKLIRQTTMVAAKLPERICKITLNPKNEPNRLKNLEKWLGPVDVRPWPSLGAKIS